MGRGRSYPAVGLGEAINRARDLYEDSGTAAATPEHAVAVWGYGGLHGTSSRVLSALKQYGLLETRGDLIALSDGALAILLDPEDSDDRQAAIQRASESPAIFSELREWFVDGLPTDRGLISHLIRNEKFNQKSAESLVEVLRETWDLADKNKPRYDSEAGGGSEEEKRTMPDPSEEIVARKKGAPVRTVKNPVGSSYMTFSDNLPGSGPMQPLTIPLRPDGTTAVLNAPMPLTMKDVTSLVAWLKWYETLMVNNATDPVATADQETEGEAGGDE